MEVNLKLEVIVATRMLWIRFPLGFMTYFYFLALVTT